MKQDVVRHNHNMDAIAAFNCSGFLLFILIRLPSSFQLQFFCHFLNAFSPPLPKSQVRTKTLISQASTIPIPEDSDKSTHAYAFDRRVPKYTFIDWSHSLIKVRMYRRPSPPKTMPPFPSLYSSNQATQDVRRRPRLMQTTSSNSWNAPRCAISVAINTMQVR
ncbi:hypothetical protein B0T19DRAFT_288971 [Cercophora scortea]|uniref:Uncharacterized protein n=1 Tax=Cercophora scortea TaxID=314031 RepID=A0AAE0M303_9PEZI|nr:hypothetical protein B0T19DRAFT_288971 [Cercophora scortea]